MPTLSSTISCVSVPSALLHALAIHPCVHTLRCVLDHSQLAWAGLTLALEQTRAPLQEGGPFQQQTQVGEPWGELLEAAYLKAQAARSLAKCWSVVSSALSSAQSVMYTSFHTTAPDSLVHTPMHARRMH